MNQIMKTISETNTLLKQISDKVYIDLNIIITSLNSLVTGLGIQNNLEHLIFINM